MEEETKWKRHWLLGSKGKSERRKLNEELIVKVGAKSFVGRRLEWCGWSFVVTGENKFKLTPAMNGGERLQRIFFWEGGGERGLLGFVFNRFCVLRVYLKK